MAIKHQHININNSQHDRIGRNVALWKKNTCKKQEKRTERLSSIAFGNVRSLNNKIDELDNCCKQLYQFRESSSICLKETWLNETVSNTSLDLDAFYLLQSDRIANKGKVKGAGLAIYVLDELESKRPDSIRLVLGNFNHVPLHHALPTYTQYVICATRSDRILDMCCGNILLVCMINDSLCLVIFQDLYVFLSMKCLKLVIMFVSNSNFHLVG